MVSLIIALTDHSESNNDMSNDHMLPWPKNYGDTRRLQKHSKTKVQSMATVLLCFAKGLMPVVTPREAKPSSTSASVDDFLSQVLSLLSQSSYYLQNPLHHIAPYCMLETNIAPPWLFEPRLLKIDSGWWHPFPWPQTNGGSGTSWGQETVACAGRLIQANWKGKTIHPLNDTYCILVIVISI